MVIGNNLDLTASLLHPGYTMASVIANEFTEATFDLYLHALIEIGLILSIITLLINVIARLLIWRVGGKQTGEALMNKISPRLRSRRKAVNFLMLSLTGIATLLVVTPLVWILLYIIHEGAPAINLKFFTQLPTPVGVAGGGIVNALLGSLMTVGLGLVIAAPIRDPGRFLCCCTS